MNRRDFLKILRPPEESERRILPESSSRLAAGGGDRSGSGPQTGTQLPAQRTMGWLNFNAAFPPGSYRHFVIEGGRVAVGPERIVVRADAPLVLLQPRTWTAEGEAFFQFFYRSSDDFDEISDHPEAVFLDAGERWSTLPGKD